MTMAGGRLRELWYRLRGWCPVQIGTETFRCGPAQLDFWDKVNSGRWEPQTFGVLDTVLFPEAVYCDIGAWIGPTVLYAARRCRQVYCFEPDRVAYRHLLENLQLNRLDKVLPFNLALAASPGMASMASPRGKPGDSMTSLLLPAGKRAMDILCLTWQNWLELLDMPVINVIKMDIEGGEFDLLPTMVEYLELFRPRLYLSLHPHLLAQEQRPGRMAAIVASLKMYDGLYSGDGRKVPLESLLESPALNRAGTYLLLSQ